MVKLLRSISGVFLLFLFFLFLTSFSHAILLDTNQKLSELHKSAIELLNRNEFDKVIELETSVLRDEPSDFSASLLLTIAYLGKGSEKKALEEAERVRGIDSRFAYRIYGDMGRFYMGKKRYHKALVYYHAGLAYQAVHQIDKAIESFEKALDINEDFPKAKDAKKRLKDLSGLD